MTEPSEQDLTDPEGVILEPDEQEQADEEEAEQEQATAPEPEPEPEAIRDDRDFEKALKALEKEAARHADRISQIMGEDAQTLEPCPLCGPSTPGFRWPVMPQGEQLAAVKAALGEDLEPEYEPDRYSNRCDACKGKGNTASRSEVPGWKSLKCIDCDGRGWVPVGPERAGGGLTASNGAATPVVAVPASAEPPDPPEVTALKQLGYIVVPPVPQAG